MQDLILNVLMWLLTTLSNIFVRPIMTLITVFIPEVETYVSETQLFFLEYVFEPMKWAVRLLLNVTGIPQAVLTFAFTYLALKITLHVGMQAVKLIIRVWGLIFP